MLPPVTRSRSLDDRVEVATLKSLLAQRRLAEINFERDQRLLATKAISRTDFDKTEAQLKDVSAQVERTEAVIARKHLRTPFAGRIGIPLVEVGSTSARAGNRHPAVPCHARSGLQTPRTGIAAACCRPTGALPRAGGTRNACSTARSARSMPRSTDNTRNVLVRARVPNPGAALLPGMFVGVEIVVEDDVEQITVEESALSYNLYGDSVFVRGHRAQP